MIPKWISKHLDGFRGSFVLMLSTPWALVGLSYILMTTPGRSRAFSYLPEFANESELGWVWILAAAIMVVCAARGKHRPSFTTVGFLTAMAPPTLWALLFAGAVLLGVSPTAIVSVVMYGAFACIIFFVSGWPNPRGSDATGGSGWKR